MRYASMEGGSQSRWQLRSSASIVAGYHDVVIVCCSAAVLPHSPRPTMLTSIAALVLLAASAVSAQDTAPSVVTFISISPSPASEALFTIQTGVPASASMACNCIQEPCAACTDGCSPLPPYPADGQQALRTAASCLSRQARCPSPPPRHPPTRPRVQSSRAQRPLARHPMQPP